MNAAEIVRALGALAQEHRLVAYRLLVQAGPEGLSAGAIADCLGAPASSVSFHLAQLLHAGLVIQRRAGRSLIYSADFARISALVAYLVDNCCGTDQNCAPVCADLATFSLPQGRKIAP